MSFIRTSTSSTKNSDNNSSIQNEPHLRKAVLDLQRLTERAVGRFASHTGPLSRLEVNHLKAYLSQIESALATLKRLDRQKKNWAGAEDEYGDDEREGLEVVERQLEVLHTVLEEQQQQQQNGKKADTHENSDTEPLLPAASKPSKPVVTNKESRYAHSLRQRPYANSSSVSTHTNNHQFRTSSKPATTANDSVKTGTDKTIFRPEHDHLSAALLHHSAALKANSTRIASLLKEDQPAVSQVERLMDSTEGAFSGHTKRLGEQVKGDSWGIMKTLMALAFGIFLFFVMFVFIRLT
jgi:hypothetical protein